MKSSSFVFCMFLVAVSASFNTGCGKTRVKDAGNSSDKAQEVRIAGMKFNSYEYDFGKVKEGEILKHSFSFVNNGTGDLVIITAVASCGCTVTRFDRKPVPPGESGTIDVSFDTGGRRGKQSKTISVESNAYKPMIMLRISAEIVF